MDKEQRKKFDALVAGKSQFLGKMRQRKKNRELNRRLAFIAIEICMTMEERGMSSEELSEQLDVSLEDVQKLCNGKLDFPVSLGVKLEKVLGVVIFNSTKLQEYTH